MMLIVPLLFACKSPATPEPSGLCPELDAPEIEVAQADVWGIEDGDPIQFGIPPQGGAPYAPFDVRLVGMQASPDGYDVVTSAWLVETGELVGTGEYNQRFVCANVGDNAGTRFAAEFHMRFFGWEPADLADREVDVEISVTPVGGEPVIAELGGPLDWVLGPMPD